MAIIVGLILVSLFFFSSATREHRPWEGFVYIDNPDPNTTEHRLPASDEDGLCGIWVNLTATQKTPLPQLEGVSTLLTIDMSFEHPNFEGTKIDHVMKIRHDGVTKEEKHICFSSCPTILDKEDQNIFTLIATTENIPRKNYVNLRVTSRKSFSYSEHCSQTDEETLVKEDVIVKETKIDNEDEIVKEAEKVNGDEIAETIFMFYFLRAAVISLAVAFIGTVAYSCRTRCQASCLPEPVPGPRSAGEGNRGDRSVSDEPSKDCSKEEIELSLVKDRRALGNVRSSGKKKKDD